MKLCGNEHRTASYGLVFCTREQGHEPPCIATYGKWSETDHRKPELARWYARETARAGLTPPSSEPEKS